LASPFQTHPLKRRDCDMKTKLIPTQNSLPEPTRRAMIELLNRQLAGTIDLGLQTKQEHWNVKGPHFIGLHELFDKVAKELEEFTDDIAERAVELGGVALGTIQIVSQKSRLSAYPLNLASGQRRVAALSGALAQFGTTSRAAIDTAPNAFGARAARSTPGSGRPLQSGRRRLARRDEIQSPHLNGC